MNDPLDSIRRALAEQREHKTALAALMASTAYGDTGACRAILNGADVADEIGGLSTSEVITVALAFGRLDLLPEDYGNFRYAWQRLDMRQRKLVDTVARAPWSHG